MKPTNTIRFSKLLLVFLSLITGSSIGAERFYFDGAMGYGPYDLEGKRITAYLPITVSPDGQTLAAAAIGENGVILISVPDGSPKGFLSSHGSVQDLKFSADGNLVFVLVPDTVLIFDWRSGEQTRVIPLEEAGYYLDVHPGGKYLVTGGRNVYLIELNSFEVKAFSDVTSYHGAFDSSGQFLVFSESRTNKGLSLVNLDSLNNKKYLPGCAEGPPNKVAVSLTGRKVVAEFGRYLCIYDVPTQTLLKKIAIVGDVDDHSLAFYGDEILIHSPNSPGSNGPAVLMNLKTGRRTELWHRNFPAYGSSSVYESGPIAFFEVFRADDRLLFFTAVGGEVQLVQMPPHLVSPVEEVDSDSPPTE